MTAAPRRGRAAEISDVLDGDEVRDILRERFFVSDPPGNTDVVAQDPSVVAPEGSKPSSGRRSPAKPRPEHYKIICISLYTEDLARLDEVVRGLKERGFTRASRSSVLRAAMQQFDPSKVTRGL
jgi:hypothetical protein